MTEPVLFQELATAGAMKIGVATLNAEKSLNSLSLEMIDLLYAQLHTWQQRDDIALVVLDAAGEKAFCAGGDIVRLYHTMCERQPGERNEYAEDFFGREYKLDYLLHVYDKPVLCWGHGIVMGGGMGLLAGASHRVVTERSRLAMPEITIGLYPDVGGSYFLNRMPGRTGLFLGLTGANINAADALFLGLADRFVAHEHKSGVLARLQAVTWASSTEKNHQALNHVLRDFGRQSRNALPASPVRAHLDVINDLCDEDGLAAIVDRITSLESDDDWLNKAASTLKRGCSQTAWLVYEQLRRGRHKSLREIFAMEWVMSVQCALHEDFREGVRALLIDKDGKPDFKYKSVADMPCDVVEEFFVSPRPENPLEAL